MEALPQYPTVMAMRAKLESAEARIAVLETANQRIREAVEHKHLNSIEKLATISTILTTCH